MVLPITLNSYGDGKGTIQSTKRLGVYILNASHIKVSNINLEGDYVGNFSGAENTIANAWVGVLVESTSKNCINVIVDNVNASNFKWSGIRFDSKNAAFSVQNSTIKNCETHSNGNRGIGTSAKNGGWNKDIMILNCRSYDNHGWNSQDITVQGCLAYNNGAYNDSDAGGVGIWASSSKNVLFQFNESHSNKTRFRDGGGFDIDGGVDSALVQYNYSHDNFGPGFLVFQHKTGSTLKNVTLRYNISENDGHFINRNNKKHSAIDVNRVGNPVSGIENVFIYNNTTFTDKDYVGSIFVNKNNGDELIKNIHVHNNLLITPIRANARRFEDSNVKHQSNYVDTDNSTVQNPGRGGNLLPNKALNTLEAYQLKNNPDVINSGSNLNQQFGFNVGSRDFYGNSIPKNGAFDIGAHEYTGGGNQPQNPCEEKLVNGGFQLGSNLFANWKVHKGNGSQANGSINQYGVAHLNISNAGSFDYVRCSIMARWLRCESR